LTTLKRSYIPLPEHRSQEPVEICEDLGAGSATPALEH
jgi:hypothetical protein